MSASERDEAPMLSESKQQSTVKYEDPLFRAFSTRTWSASLSTPSSSTESYQGPSHLVGYTGPLRSERKATFSPMSGPLYPRPQNFSQINPDGGGHKVIELPKQIYPSFNVKDTTGSAEDNYAAKNAHLLRSGQLGMCNDPYCTTCPTYYNTAAQRKNSKGSALFDPFHHSFYGDARGWARRFSSYISRHIPGVMNPHAKFVQKWNKFFVISCLIAVFFDPLFFFLLTVESGNKCIVLNRPVKTNCTTLVVLRSLTDFIYFLHILLQFRLAYIAPESRVFGSGDLVDQPKKIALNYLHGYFFLDLFIALPLPQIMILLVLPHFKGSTAANYATAILFQYIPRLYRFLPLLVGQSPTGFIFESAWTNFVMNLLTFVLSGHVIGSTWYLFGLQRVNKCLQEACHPHLCDFMDCGYGKKIARFSTSELVGALNSWKKNENATKCFTEDGLDYGIYIKAVNLTTVDSIATRYIYSLFWGFQQISTLAGNQIPSYFVGEVLFTMLIIGLGLLLFAFLVGNMQNFLQALGRRRLEMSLRRRDVEQWMSHRCLPEELRSRVHQAERYNWAATRGVNEEVLLDNLPEDLQIHIRRHLFKFVKKIRIFALMDDIVLDAVCEKLRQKTFIKGSKILNRGGLIERMIFIVRGKMESVGDDVIIDLSEGDVCGEELLENSSVSKEGKRLRVPGQRLHSNRMVKCLSNVEAFALRAADLEEVTMHFSRFFRNPQVQGAIRYISPYWRGWAATRIQVAWRYRKKCLTRANTAQSRNTA